MKFHMPNAIPPPSQKTNLLKYLDSSHLSIKFFFKYYICTKAANSSRPTAVFAISVSARGYSSHLISLYVIHTDAVPTKVTIMFTPLLVTVGHAVKM